MRNEEECVCSVCL